MKKNIWKIIYFLITCPFFVSWFLSFGKRYEIDLRVIFYQWPNLDLGWNVEAEIQILKVIWLPKSQGILQICIKGVNWNGSVVCLFVKYIIMYSMGNFHSLPCAHFQDLVSEGLFFLKKLSLEKPNICQMELMIWRGWDDNACLTFRNNSIGACSNFLDGTTAVILCSIVRRQHRWVQ